MEGNAIATLDRFPGVPAWTEDGGVGCSFLAVTKMDPLAGMGH